MPTPNPVPTETELITTGEIALWTYDFTKSIVAADSEQAVSDAKWAMTLQDIALWPAMRLEAGDVKKVGSIEFFEDKTVDARLDFRNAIRIRYNQPLLTSETPVELTTAGQAMGSSGSCGVRSQQWF